MAISAKVEGLSKLQKKLRRIPIAARPEVGEAIKRSALLVQSTAQRGIQKGPKSGIVYEKYNPRRTHRASAPGEFPATDTGRLVASISVDVDQDELGASVGTNLAYGTHLEFGTTKMAARPWLFPTFESLKPRITKSIANAVRKVLRRESR